MENKTNYKTHHMSISIRGVLKWKPKALQRIFQNDDGSRTTLDEVKEFLFDKLQQGYEVLPMNGVECEGWDKVKGCPSHASNIEEFNKLSNKHEAILP